MGVFVQLQLLGDCRLWWREGFVVGLGAGPALPGRGARGWQGLRRAARLGVRLTLAGLDRHTSPVCSA